MQEVLLKTLVTNFSKELVQKSSPLLKDLKDEVNYFFDNGVSSYLEKQKNKYAYTKNLLHRSSPVYFYDVYQPINVSGIPSIGYELFGELETVDTSSVNRVFWKTQFVTVIGDAGSGKSTLIKHLFLNSIVENFCIPILIELRYLNDYTGSIEDYIKERVFENKLSPNNKILERLLENGKFVFFLDGYDEIKSTSKERVVEKLICFIDKYRSNRYLITSRPHSNIELLPSFHNYKIDSLDNTQIKEFILRQKIHEELARKIITSIKKNEISYIKSYLTNPLLLSLYILTFSTNSTIPKKKYIFYRRVWDVLFKEHDSISKIGFERELLTNLSQEEFEKVLKAFSFLTYFDGEYDFEKDYLNKNLNIIKGKIPSIQFSNVDFITDLKSSIALWVEDGAIVSFAHRSMQEYFAALYTQCTIEKEKVYGKIKKKLSTGKKSPIEYFNFLSLCEEMDTYFYTKHMLLPSLKYLWSQINPTNKKNQLLSCLTFFISNVHVPKYNTEFNPEGPTITTNSKNFSHFFAVYHFQRDFSYALLGLSPRDEFFQYVLKNNFQDESRWFKGTEGTEYASLDFEKSLNKEGLAKLSNGNLLKKSKEMVSFVKKQIKEAEKYLIESQKNEEDFIDLL